MKTTKWISNRNLLIVLNSLPDNYILEINKAGNISVRDEADYKGYILLRNGEAKFIAYDHVK